MAAWVGNTGKKMGIGNHLLADLFHFKAFPLSGTQEAKEDPAGKQRCAGSGATQCLPW